MSYLVNTLPADALVPKVTRASSGMVLTVKDRQHIGLLHCEFGLILMNKIKVMIWNVNASLIVFKHFIITRVNLTMWVPVCPRQTRTISWLLMSWLLVSPGHQQSWYWSYKMGMLLSSLRVGLHNLSCFSFVETWNVTTYPYFPKKILLCIPGICYERFLPEGNKCVFPTYWSNHEWISEFHRTNHKDLNC